jgi:hypothetical protein
MKRYISVDNGVTGSLTIMWAEKVVWYPTPVRKCLDYTKTKKWLNRVDGEELKEILMTGEEDCQSTLAILERPMINPIRWNASMSAIRCLEATLIVLELLKLPYSFIDSKIWQKELLPSGLQKEELKEASYQVAKRLFPNLDFKKDGADSVLICEYARKNL